MGRKAPKLHCLVSWQFLLSDLLNSLSHLLVISLLLLTANVNATPAAAAASTAIEPEIVETLDFTQTTLEQFQRLFHIEDEPENLCAGEQLGQFSCNRARNLRISDLNSTLDLFIDKNLHSKRSFLFFNGAKIVSKSSWTAGRIDIRAKQPTGKFVRSMIGLRSLAANGIDWDKSLQTCLVYSQIPDTILYKMYDKNITTKITELWTKKHKKAKRIIEEFHNYTIEWSSSGVQWRIDGTSIAQQKFSDQNAHRRWHFIVQLGVGGPEFPELRSSLPPVPSSDSWKKPEFSIESIQFTYSFASRLELSSWALIFVIILFIL